MIRRLAVSLAAIACLAAPALSGAQNAQLPPLGALKPFSVPASETFRLPNGMQVTLIPYGLTPTTTINLRVYAGGLNAGQDVWLNSLTASMLKEGAAGRTGAQIAETAASMGGSLSVTVDPHETSLALTVLREHSPAAIQLIADIARRPDFPASEFERVRGNWLRNLAVSQSQPQALADVALAAAYYGQNHPYGRPYPTEQQLRGYTPADVRRFYDQNFGARRSRLYIAGRFDAAQMRAAIERAFADWAPGPERLQLPPQPQPGPRLILVDRPGAEQSTLRIAFAAPKAGSPHDIPMRVTDTLLGGAFNSRITTNIRESKGYTYSPSSDLIFNPGEAQWAFYADVSTNVTGPALKEVFHEIRRMQTEPATADEAAGMSTYLAGIFVLQNATPQALIGSLATRDFHGLPANWLESYVPGVLAVTPADMQRIAREQLPLEKATVVVVGDLAKVVPQLKALPELRNMKMETVKPF